MPHHQKKKHHRMRLLVITMPSRTRLDEAGGFGEGKGTTAAEVIDSSSTQQCNGRRDSSSIVIAIDGGDSDDRHWCKGRRDDSGNGSAIAMSGNSFYVQEPPLSFSSIFGVERNFLV